MCNNKIRTVSMAIALALSAPVALHAQAPVDESDARVTVELGDFAKMQETKYLRGTSRRDTEQGITSLAEWLTKQAARSLPQDQTLQITLHDVDLAGEYQPGRGMALQDVRIVKDIYPPRIELSWQILGADGATISAGETVLRDTGFMTGSNAIATDPLRYEKRMLSNWLNEELFVTR